MSKRIYNISDCKVIELGKYYRPNGNLTAVEGANNEIGFDIKRVYYIYDVPAASDRGGHAHKNLMQLIVAVSGSFDVLVDDGRRIKTITLNRPNVGLLLPPGIWREIKNFSSGAVTLVLASAPYDETDYVRTYAKFMDYRESLK
ncbi:MAG: WxcM-like domain-containing protein [Bacteroidales bacterium]|nr:WxcM-like domain-containing protein [Bacteroidales bacterium]MBR5532385.1 WxcM-like domain-containing protein [Bacteroidales bacterium]